MTKPGKTPKKKTKEKSPQRTEGSEYPAMDEETYNRLLRNAIEHSKAELEAKLQQQHKEQLKEVEERLTKKFDDEVRELSRAFDDERYAFDAIPTVYGHVRSLFTSTKLRVFNPAAFGSQGAWD